MTNDHGGVADARIAHRTFRNPQSEIRNWQGLIGVSLLVVCLASCARPPAQPARVGGVAVGMASWYGPEFHGKRTSSGEIYDMYQLTAAHRELPLGTWIMVANLDNGRSVEVRVNDRGPFVADRIVDLSYGAARLLGMIGPGVIPVRVTITRLAVGEQGVALGPKARFTVQAGSFISLENARALERSLAEGFPGVEVVRRTVGQDTYFRVWVGDFSRRADAMAVAEKLARRGLAVLVMERDR
jgi:peptidoglycan lytic transglycosylase